MSARKIAATLLATVAAALGWTAAAGAEPRTLELLSDGSAGLDAALESRYSAESDDGSHVLIRTLDALTASDTDAVLDAYVRTPAGAFIHVTDNPIAADAEIEVSNLHASSDLGYVFFTTGEQLAATDTDTATDAYARTPSGALIHVSDDPTGADDGKDARSVAMSRDGRHLFFQTTESLAATDTDAGYDVYELGPAGLRHLTDDPTGPDGDDGGELIAASDDGTRMLFYSSERLATTDTDSAYDIYLHTETGALVHVSDDPTGPDANLNANFNAAAPDGGRVWFSTEESLAGTDADSADDAYEWTAGGGLTHLTRNPAETVSNLPVFFGAGSADGHAVFFATAEPMAPTDTDAALDVYERLPGGALVHVSDDPTGPDANVDAAFAGASADGSRAFFETTESLAATDADAKRDAYERSPGGALVHLSDDPTGPDAEIDAQLEAVSRDGSRVVLKSEESFAATDADTAFDLYARAPAAALVHVSVNRTDPGADGNASMSGLSSDGTRIYFRTAEKLVAGDTDAVADVYRSTAVPGPPRPSGPPADATAPRLTGLRVVPGRIARARRARARVRFVLSEPARVRFTVKRGSRAPVRFTVDARAGRNAVRLRGRLRGGGRYRLTATPRDRAGNAGRPRRTTFRLLATKEKR